MIILYEEEDSDSDECRAGAGPPAGFIGLLCGLWVDREELLAGEI